MLRIAHRQTPAVQQAYPVGLFVDGEVSLGAGFWRHDNQAIPQQRFAGCRINRFLLHRVIHPLLVSRDEQIRRCARFYLARQRRGRGKRGDHLDVFLFFIRRRDILQRVSQRRRRKDRDFTLIRQRVSGKGKRQCCPCKKAYP